MEKGCRVSPNWKSVSSQKIIKKFISRIYIYTRNALFDVFLGCRLAKKCVSRIYICTKRTFRVSVTPEQNSKSAFRAYIYTRNALFDFFLQVSHAMVTKKNFQTHVPRHVGCALDRSNTCRKKNYRSSDQIFSKSKIT